MASRRTQPWWAELPYEDLLDVRLSDLGLKIQGTALEGRVERLNEELARVGIRFRPHVWLSHDWFTPDGVTGFAIPFFLAHRRLARIEHHQMLEVEGGTHSWCMKLLRHEAGHALDNAYRLHRKKRWRQRFGSFSQPYRSTYVPKPDSRRYVLNLDYWYSHSHPAEDYAETFAVWLQPGSNWRRRYADWPAIKKLRYLEEQMQEIAGEPPAVRNRERPDSLPRIRMTLREYYRRKMAFYASDEPTEYDHYLRRIFSEDSGTSHRTAVSFLLRTRHELRTRVASLTGQYRYVVDQALKIMIARCRELRLRLTRSERETRIEAAVLLTILTMSFTQGRRRFRR